MKDFEKLLESGLLDEEAVTVLREALEAKVSERLEESKEELREEFALKYEHNKKVMIEAADSMFNDHLRSNLKEINEEKNAVIAEKVKYKKMIKEHAKVIQKFAVGKLKTEISELRMDRKGLAEALVVFEKFAVKKITEELKEFHQDKRSLVETKVNLIKNAKAKLAETKKDFVQRASRLVESKVEATMRKELTDFRKDIKESRKNYFGRRIFEAFQAEFLASHASDGTKVKEFASAVRERDIKLSESKSLIESLKEDIKAASAKKILAESKLVRYRKMNELLSPLPRDKKELMASLLEQVQTSKLDESYKKHIKYVLSESNGQAKRVIGDSSKKNTLKEATGNKRIVESRVADDSSEVETSRLKRLAGIK